MKITDKHRTYTPSRIKSTPKSDRRYYPHFGISFKPKILKDIFLPENSKGPLGISKIKDMHSGEYGTECKGSRPLANFMDCFDNDEFPAVQIRGISTNTDGYADCFLKTAAANPISTSSVYDCSVMYLFNRDTNTHLMYHTYFNKKESDFSFIINNCMQEGYTKADIIAGDKMWLKRHMQTLPNIFKAIRKNNKDAEINIHHYNSILPEIVGYMGNVYEIPNFRTSLGLSDKGQASFKVCDVPFENFIDRINSLCSSSKIIEDLKEQIKSRGYDREILKIFDRLLDSKLAEIKEIEACRTIKELENLVQSRKTAKYNAYCKAVELRKRSILSGEKF